MKHNRAKCRFPTLKNQGAKMIPVQSKLFPTVSYLPRRAESTTITHSQEGREPKMKNVSVGFSFFHQNVGRFRSVLKTKPKKNETETERFSVGFSFSFSVGFSVKPAKKSTFQRIQSACVGITCDDRIVWCQEQTKSYLNQAGSTRLY